MKKPSPQFIGKLENELRLAYRAQYHPQEELQVSRRGLGQFFKFFVPAFSGVLVLAIVLNGQGVMFNNSGANFSQQLTQIQVQTSDDQFVAFTEGKEEEQIIDDFDNEELNQIDSEVRLIAEANF